MIDSKLSDEESKSLRLHSNKTAEWFNHDCLLSGNTLIPYNTIVNDL